MTISSSYKPHRVSFRSYSLPPTISPLKHAISFRAEFAERVRERFLYVIPIKERTGVISFIVREIAWALIGVSGRGLAFISAMDPSEFKAGGIALTRNLLQTEGIKFALEAWDMWAACALEIRSKAGLEVAISVWNDDTGFHPASFDIYVSDSLSLDQLGEETKDLLRAGPRKATHALGPRCTYIIGYPPAANGTELQVLARDQPGISEALRIVKSVLDAHGVGLRPLERK